MRLLAEGMSNGEIAKTRFVSEKSVEQIVARIALNMGIVPNRKKNLRVLMTTNSIAGWDRLKLLSGIVALMDLADIRSKWSEVLNQLEKNNRTAWLVYFDARLANWDGNKLTLDFSDSDKLGYGIEYNDKRAKYLNELQDAIRTVCGIDAEILT
ncbi:MAG: LuxR C-terminal-related transcriptional regulator [Actinomycetota bacterium]